MAQAYSQRPASWVLPAAKLNSPEGQIFAFDFDRTVFLLGRTFEAEQRELARQRAKLRASSGAGFE